ncbi:bridging integrator 2a isoform X2 [Nerophis ophidion]|uniref:bridging integrator 2a isoform X2 n=1 Tax=Nerophis ophidion TaxID=159077 RepID=UPI002AE04133|nr:bridging integrator 2a isoform X2 [Nerophis ophidion]
MADHTSPKGSSGDFAKKVQRRLSRGKEKVLQKLGKSVETRDDQLERYVLQFQDQQADGNRIYKELSNYIEAVREMREASRRLSQSLFDVYESHWVGEEDIGAIVEGEDLLWNDYEVKLLDQAVRTMESYVGQFPDVREKVAKRGRKLVDYDSSRHHLEALQTAKKRDDVKISKAEEEMTSTKRVYDAINSELKEELPELHESRIGCYVTVFSAVSSVRDVFYREMRTLNMDLDNVLKELQAQHPDKVFAVHGVQRLGSLRRRTLLSPKAWKSSFSDFHRGYNPNKRFSFRSPEKPRHGSLSRESAAAVAVVPLTPTPESPASESRGSSRHQAHAPAEARENQAADQEPDDGSEDSKAPEKTEDAAAASESSCDLNNSCESPSLDLQLGEVPPDLSLDSLKVNGLEDGHSQDLDLPRQDLPADAKHTSNDLPADAKHTSNDLPADAKHTSNDLPADSKSTEV